jgi:hypothetical protein
MADFKPELWIAIYAAILSTGGLFLGVRRWFESGPRLMIDLIPDGITIGGGPDTDEKDLVIVMATNRGEAATMITNLLLFEFETRIQRFRNRAKRSFVIPNPQLKGYPPNLPHVLEPGRFWTGAIRQRKDIIQDIHTGNFYIGISTTHCDRPHLKRIPKRKAKKDNFVTLPQKTPA